ncbi:MAG: hypothetical protein AB4041_12250 [Microcystaceae cyanobacterium]
MLGTFQQSQLRIELAASQTDIKESLLDTRQLRRWLFPQFLSSNLPEQLTQGTHFTSWTGGIPVTHQVEMVNESGLRMILSQGIDGYHEWYWGEGWVQSRLEGISLLPLSLGQTLSLVRLRLFVTQKSNKSWR